MRRFEAFLELTVDVLFCCAQRAFCAARILARPLALNFRLPPDFAPSRPPYAPAKAASAAFSPFNCRAILSLSAFNSTIMFGISPPQKEILSSEIASFLRYSSDPTTTRIRRLDLIESEEIVLGSCPLLSKLAGIVAWG
jgi:hypothetical protein